MKTMTPSMANSAILPSIHLFISSQRVALEVGTCADPSDWKTSRVRNGMKGPMYSANQAVEFSSGLLWLKHRGLEATVKRRRRKVDCLP